MATMTVAEYVIDRIAGTIRSGPRQCRCSVLRHRSGSVTTGFGLIVLEHTEQEFTLRKPTFFGRKFTLEEGSRNLGFLMPDGPSSNNWIVDLDRVIPADRSANVRNGSAADVSDLAANV